MRRNEFWGERPPEEADRWRRRELWHRIASGMREKREEGRREERGGRKGHATV
jgi:hypothetical protein